MVLSSLKAPNGKRGNCSRLNRACFKKGNSWDGCLLRNSMYLSKLNQSLHIKNIHILEGHKGFTDFGLTLKRNQAILSTALQKKYAFSSVDSPEKEK